MSNILVLGGAGGLGRAVVRRFAAAQWNTINVDYKTNDESKNSVLLSSTSSWQDQAGYIAEFLENKRLKLDGVVCTAGGWSGGAVNEKNGLDSVQSMWEMNVQSAVVASHIASKYLLADGMLVLTGATAALDGTPGMAGYGISKAATHQLVKTMGVPGALNERTCSVGVLPITIDTPANRESMPDADFSSWTSPEDMAMKIFEWHMVPHLRPPSGSLMNVVTTDGASEWTEAS